jgi:hypothetical protein
MKGLYLVIGMAIGMAIWSMFKAMKSAFEMVWALLKETILTLGRLYPLLGLVYKDSPRTCSIHLEPTKAQLNNARLRSL